MQRREFITALGGASVWPAATWPLAARAQQSGAMRRIGVLMNRTANDPEASSFVGAFAQLAELGWTIGRNVRVPPPSIKFFFWRLAARSTEANKLRYFHILAGRSSRSDSTSRRVSVVPPGTNGTHDAYGVARIGFGPRGGDERDMQEHALPHSPTSACTRSTSCSATPRWRMISPNASVTMAR